MSYYFTINPRVTTSPGLILLLAPLTESPLITRCKTFFISRSNRRSIHPPVTLNRLIRHFSVPPPLFLFLHSFRTQLQQPVSFFLFLGTYPGDTSSQDCTFTGRRWCLS